MIIVLIILLVAVIALPFLPGFIELKGKRDADALMIPNEKTIHYLWIGDRFEEWIRSLETSPGISKVPVPGLPGAVEIKHENKESLAMVFEGNLDLAANSSLNANALAKGHVTAGDHCIVKSLLGYGDIKLGEDTIIQSWLVCRGNKLEVADNSVLGHCCSCKGEITIGQKVCFELIYGGRILFCGESRPGDMVYEKRQGPIISSMRVVVNSGSEVLGDVSSSGSVILEDNAFVNGSVFSDEDIIVGSNCIILGNIFSQGKVIIGDNVSVGTEGRVISVISGENMIVGKNVEVYGQVRSLNGITK